MVLTRFIIWTVKEIIERAEAEWYSPEFIRMELSRWQYLLEIKEVTPEEYQKHEKILFQRLMEGQERERERGSE
jgi:hypothetical protein